MVEILEACCQRAHLVPVGSYQAHRTELILEEHC